MLLVQPYFVLLGDPSKAALLPAAAASPVSQEYSCPPLNLQLFSEFIAFSVFAFPFLSIPVLPSFYYNILFFIIIFFLKSGAVSAGQAAEHKIAQLESCVQNRSREAARLKMERARLSHDVRRLRKSCKARVVEGRPAFLQHSLNPTETQFRQKSGTIGPRESPRLAPSGHDFGRGSDRVGHRRATTAGPDAREGGGKEKSSWRGGCVEAEEGGEGGAASEASSPLVSVSVLSEPASDSPSKWLLSDRRGRPPPFASTRS